MASKDQRMDDRVHAQMVAHGLAFGLTSEEALRWADSRMKSTEAAMLRLELAGNDLMRELRRSAEAGGAKVARALTAFSRR